MKYNITPVPAPRQTRSDKWKARPVVLRYRAFKDEINLHGVTVSESDTHIIFHMPMANSWSEKKKQKMEGKPHQQKPDVDNLVKSVLDAIFKDDAHIWRISAEKRWAKEGALEILNLKVDT